MAVFWTWGVRPPAFVDGALFLAAGATAVTDWAFAFTGAAVCGFVVETSRHLAKRAEQRWVAAQAEQLKQEALEGPTPLQFRVAALEEEKRDEAA